MSSFHDRMAIDVTLTIGGTPHTIVGGCVSALELKLRTYGFEGELEFWVHLDAATDEINAPFLTPQLATVAITIAGWIPETTSPPDPITVTGVVEHKTFTELAIRQGDGSEIRTRIYRVSFRDAPAVLWQQHWPSVVAAETTLATVLGAHVVEGVTLDASHADATTQHSHICLPLGGTDCSLWDFIVWFAHTHAASLTYDYTAKKWIVADAKPTLGTAALVEAQYVHSVRTIVPPVPRHAARVLNSYTVSPATTDVTQSNAVTGLYLDHVVRAPISADVDALVSRETSRLASPKPELEVAFSRIPTVQLSPGKALKFATGIFSSQLFGHGSTFRVTEVDIQVTASDDMITSDWLMPNRGYTGSLTTRWEASDDPAMRYPAYVPPQYPLVVEGTMVCDQGAEGDKTWANEEDSQTSLVNYRVKLPVFDCIVRTPFEPMFLPGHFFAPTYRASRVLVALEYNSARIERHLDWGPNVALPMDGQGNHLLFGKNQDSQTSLKHEYVSDKPVLTVLRNNAGDTELIKLEDGILILQTKEEQAS